MSNGAKVFLGWHISREETLNNGDGRKIRPGVVFSVEGPIAICENGLHASPTLGEALRHVNSVCHGNDNDPAAYVSFVEVWGSVKERDDGSKRKFCGRFRRHVAVAKITAEEQRLILNGNEAAEVAVMRRVFESATVRTARVFSEGAHRFTEHRTGLAWDREARIAARLRKRNGQKKARKAA